MEAKEKEMFKRKRDPIIILTATIMLLLAALGFRMPEANAAAGCLGQVREQTSRWSHTSIYASPKSGAGIHMVGHEVKMVANMFYIYCKNATEGDFRQIKVKSVNVCWLIVGDKGFVFDGVKVDPYTYSDVDGNTWNFKEFKIKDDDSKQNCKGQGIPKEDRTWAKMKNEPRWNMWSQVVRSGLPDESWENWRTPSSEVKRYRPKTDLVTIDWYWGS